MEAYWEGDPRCGGAAARSRRRLLAGPVIPSGLGRWCQPAGHM